MPISATENLSASPASHVLAGVFALAFLAILFVCSLRGYRRGPIRSLAPLIAFALAGTFAWLFGADLGFALLGDVGIPWILRGVAGIALTATLVWLPVFSLLWWRGRSQISEQTGEPEYPVFGAVVGCWIGFFWAGACVLALAAAGTLGEALNGGARAQSRGLRGDVCRAAIRARASVALIPGLHFVENWNPLPESFVRKIDKLVAVLSDPAVARKFIYADEVQSVLTLPAAYPIVNSPKIQRMLAARDVDGILSDPDVNRMLDDPDLRRAVAEIDFESLLDSVLAAKTPPPTPSEED
ncbi:MAG: hypothetical protein ACI4QA_05495 [Candidatus Spyradosoma sp.]